MISATQFLIKRSSTSSCRKTPTPTTADQTNSLQATNHMLKHKKTIINQRKTTSQPQLKKEILSKPSQKMHPNRITWLRLLAGKQTESSHSPSHPFQFLSSSWWTAMPTPLSCLGWVSPKRLRVIKIGKRNPWWTLKWTHSRRQRGRRFGDTIKRKPHLFSQPPRMTRTWSPLK